ncbi:MAG: DinB family protein [Ignavibacterium sp.]|nr:DinB family protein [Ignavibacterium sp.]
MLLTKLLIEEIEQEAINTKKMLERVPAEKFDWRPHQKSMTLKQLAVHIANLSKRPAQVITTQYLDLADSSIKKPEINNPTDLIKEFEEGTSQSIDALKSVSDDDLNVNWIMRRGEHIIINMPKAAAIRNMGLSHLYHHRAQLGVYLRLLDIPVPGMYGQSADDKLQTKE